MADHQDLQILVKDILEGVGAMISESEERTTNRLMAYIENGVQKDVRLLAEQVGVLSQDMIEVKGRLIKIEDRLENLEGDMQVVKAVVTSHSEEIHTLKRAK